MKNFLKPKGRLKKKKKKAKPLIKNFSTSDKWRKIEAI